MAEVQQEKNLPLVIRPECHFLEFPFCVLSRKGLQGKTKLIFRYEEVRQDTRGVFEWIVLPSAEYGFPASFDRRVMRAVDAVVFENLKENGYPVENPIPFSIYHLTELMRLSTRGGTVYKQTKNSLRRIVATTVSSSGSFWLKDKRRWIEDVFHVYDKVRFAGEKNEDGKGADTNYLWLGDFILRNINSQHVRPLNYIYLAGLRNDSAGRLYEILSGKFYGLIHKGGKYFNIDYLTLCQLLPIKPQRYLSKAKEKLGPAHDELIKTGFLAKVVLRKGKDGFVVEYYPGDRASELVEPALMNDPDDNQMLLPFVREEDESIQLSELGQKLHERGLSRAVAIQFCQKHAEDYLRQKMEMFDFLRSSDSDLISKNPAGWLRKAIEKDWQPTEDQKRSKEIEAQKSQEQERQARWIEHRETLIEQELEIWDDTPSEQRIKPRLEAWKMVNSGVTEEELENRKQEYIDGLPKTYEEKREYLFRNYPDHPPDDFE